MKDIEERLLILRDKWKYASPDAYETCRDALEEIRVLRATIEGYRLGARMKSNEYDTYQSLGWGKGKDE
jgi:hypothetical protein